MARNALRIIESGEGHQNSGEVCFLFPSCSAEKARGSKRREAAGNRSPILHRKQRVFHNVSTGKTGRSVEKWVAILPDISYTCLVDPLPADYAIGYFCVFHLSTNEEGSACLRPLTVSVLPPGVRYDIVLLRPSWRPRILNTASHVHHGQGANRSCTLSVATPLPSRRSTPSIGLSQWP